MHGAGNMSHLLRVFITLIYPRFFSKHPQGRSHDYPIHMWYTYKYADKTIIHKNKNK